jgi:hypothetical protein
VVQIFTFDVTTIADRRIEKFIIPIIWLSPGSEVNRSHIHIVKVKSLFGEPTLGQRFISQ